MTLTSEPAKSPSPGKSEASEHDPKKCFYHGSTNCGVCGYCTGRVADAAKGKHGTAEKPTGQWVYLMPGESASLKACGHRSGVWCNCIKYRREPLSDEQLEALLASERDDPLIDYASGHGY